MYVTKYIYSTFLFFRKLSLPLLAYSTCRSGWKSNPISWEKAKLTPKSLGYAMEGVGKAEEGVFGLVS